MIGAPIYLVSACGSSAEFVAAFRRYADKQGIFVPIAEPFAIGRRGRIALTLKDGGVMIEGEAEVVMSARTPSALYGRIGMTLRFVEPDDDSRKVIGELERARLSMKLPETTSVPRPATVPAEPRPVAPSPGGRIDAANALAESIAIGDVSGLRETAGAPLKTGPKFVIPSIPSGGTRPPEFKPMVRQDSKLAEAIKPAGDRPAGPSKATLPPPSPVTSPPIGDPATKPVPADPPPADVSPPPPVEASQPPPVEASKPVDTSPLHLAAGQPAPSVGNTAEAHGSIDASQPPAVASEPPPVVANQPPIVANQPPIVANQPPVVASEPPPPVEPPKPKATITQPIAVVAPPRPPTDRGDASRPPTDRAALTSAAAPSTRSPITATQPVAIAPPPAPRVRGTLPPVEVLPPRKVPDATGSSAVIASAAEGRRAALDDVFPVDGVYPDGSRVIPDPVIESSTTSREDPTDLGETVRSNSPFDLLPPPPILEAAPWQPEVEIAEPTDLAAVPVPDLPEVRESRKTRLGMAAVIVEPALPAVRLAQSPAEPAPGTGADDVDPHGDTLSPDAMMIFSPPPRHALDPPLRPEALAHPPTIEESTPSGDWTMTPDGPIATPKSSPPGSPPGDWTISVDASAPDGWAPPAQPLPAKPKRKGPSITSAASREDLVLKQSWEPESTAMGMAKVEIDPTLMEPLLPMPLDDEPLPPGPATLPPPEMQPSPWPTPPPMGAPMAVVMPQQYGAPMLTPVPGMYYTPAPGQVHYDPNQQAAMMGFPQQRLATEGGAVYFHETGGVPRQDSTAMNIIAHRRRLLVIIMSAALVVALGIVLLVTLGGGKKHGDDAKPDALDHTHAVAPPLPAGSAAEERRGSIDAAVALVLAAPDAATGSDKPPVATVVDAGALLPTPDAAEAVAECTIDVATTPPGAEVMLDNKTVLGTSPGKFPLPCGAELKLFIRKAAYGGVIRTVTPTPEGAKVRVSLLHNPMSVKVSSTPAGASITANGKPMGTTPTVIKLPAFEAATIVFAKDGYAGDTERITPKSDKQAVHAQLKKLPKRR